MDNKDGKDGSGDFEAISKELGELAPVAVAATGSGGWHLFFARPDVDVSGRTNVKWKGKQTGIDIRVGNQYIILPPSLHEFGQRYSWQKTLVLPDELSPLPQAWIDGFLPLKNETPPSPVATQGRRVSIMLSRKDLHQKVDAPRTAFLFQLYARVRGMLT